MTDEKIIDIMKERAEMNIRMAARLFNDFIEADNPMQAEHYRSEHYRYIDRAYEDLNALNQMELLTEAEVEITMGNMLNLVRRNPDNV